MQIVLTVGRGLQSQASQHQQHREPSAGEMLLQLQLRLAGFYWTITHEGTWLVLCADLEHPSSLAVGVGTTRWGFSRLHWHGGWITTKVSS